MTWALCSPQLELSIQGDISSPGMCTSAWIPWLADILHQFVQLQPLPAPGCRSRTLQDIQRAQRFTCLRTGGTFSPELLLLLQEWFQLSPVHLPAFDLMPVASFCEKKGTKKKQVGICKQCTIAKMLNCQNAQFPKTNLYHLHVCVHHD